MDMSASDYDGRTALHLAAAEGHLPVVSMLLHQCNVVAQPRDRYVCFDWKFSYMYESRHGTK